MNHKSRPVPWHVLCIYDNLNKYHKLKIMVINDNEVGKSYFEIKKIGSKKFIIMVIKM